MILFNIPDGILKGPYRNFNNLNGCFYRLIVENSFILICFFKVRRVFTI